MALITDVDCSVCGETKEEVTDRSGVCSQCRHDLSSKARRVHLAGLKGLTTEERLNRIETQLYDLHVGQRLDAIEARTAGVY